MPEVEERETWGDTTFRVRNKIFVITSPEGGSASVKASLDDQSGLLEMDPDTFSRSAYVGRFGWVRVELARLSPGLADRLIKNAWRLAAPKRLVAKHEEAG
jgi:hypothetical protein